MDDQAPATAETHHGKQPIIGSSDKAQREEQSQQPLMEANRGGANSQTVDDNPESVWARVQLLLVQGEKLGVF